MADPRTDEAIGRIVEAMLADTWEVGTSHREWSKQYGVTVETVRNWAADASRFIRLCAGDEQEIKDELLRSIRRVGRLATKAGDYRSANGSLELACKVHGLLGDKRREEDTTEPFPAEQMAAALRAAGYDVKERDAADTRASEPRDDSGDEAEQSTEELGSSRPK